MFIFDKVYKKNRTSQSGNTNSFVKKALRYIKPDSRGLDLGCGQGQNIFYFASKNFKMTAVDLSNIAVKQIKERISEQDSKNIEVIQADISNYDIASNYYDFVVCLNVLQFLDKRNIIKLINRVKNKIKKNGIIIISSFTNKDPSNKTKKRSIKYHFKQGELANMFRDFECLHYSEGIVVDKGHPGKEEKHIHGIVEIIARKC
ncbi:MAG TPA: methyltransferase domain-containing protein [Candidatus Moranbacteria bacterium]|nr:methyltransferase domain-containing protein [Candidatus Moranbacteria bacterium]